MLEALAKHHLLARDLSRSFNTAVQICTRFDTHAKSFLLLATVARELGSHKLAMLAFARSYDLDCANEKSTNRRGCIKASCVRTSITNWVLSSLRKSTMPNSKNLMQSCNLLS